MKKLVAVLAVLVAFVSVPVVVNAQEALEAPVVKAAETQPTRVAVVFEKSVRNREVLELTLQEALRDAGYTPVIATGVRQLRSEKDWKRLPAGTENVLFVADAKVVNRRVNDTAPVVTIGKVGRIGGRVKFQKTVVSIDAKMVNVANRVATKFGHGSGQASNMERISISTAGFVSIVKTGGLYRQLSKQDVVYKAAKEAATEAIKSLR